MMICMKLLLEFNTVYTYPNLIINITSVIGNDKNLTFQSNIGIEMIAIVLYKI